MDTLFNYPHYVSLAFVVATITLFSGAKAHQRRGNQLIGDFFPLDLLIVFPFMLFHFLFAYLLPAIILIFVFDAIFSMPESIPNIVLRAEVYQLATIFAMGANFADVASTYTQATFWRHMREYLIIIPLAYYFTMALAWLIVHSLALMIHYPSVNVSRSWQLFAVPFLTTQPLLNVILFTSIFLAEGVVCYFFRKHGELR